MATTIQDIAKASGVGVGTVSRVLNGSTNVSKETSEKVLRVIKELNYTPNSLGAKLRTNQNMVIALLIPVINHTFFAELTAHVEKEAEKYGYSILLVCSQDHVEREKEIFNKLNRNEVDGLIFVTHYDHSLGELKNKNIVTIDRHFADITHVSSNNYDASREAIEYLVEKGCKKIAYLGSKPFVDSEVLLREKAYIDVMNKYGMEHRMHCVIINHGEEQQKVDEFIKMYPDVDGIFVSGTLMSSALHRTLLKIGKKIPDEVQIISYDGFFGEYKENNVITCVEQPVAEIARTCIKVLMDLFHKRKPNKEYILKSRLIINKTTK